MATQQRKKPKPLCVYCCKEPATSRDHVPPKCIFAAPLPSNLITVPACRTCNNRFSEGDELFALFASLNAGLNGPHQRTLADKVKRSVRYNRDYQRLILQASRPLPIFGKTGEIEDYVCTMPATSFPVSETLERIVVGLAYAHYKLLVNQVGYVNIHHPTEQLMQTSWIRDVINRCDYSHIGHNHEFGYRHARATDAPNCTFWDFMIYKTFRFTAVTMPLVW